MTVLRKTGPRKKAPETAAVERGGAGRRAGARRTNSGPFGHHSGTVPAAFDAPRPGRPRLKRKPKPRKTRVARAYKRDSRQGALARELWVVQQASERETVAAAGISRNTLRKWRDYYGWDAERAQIAKGFQAMMGTLRKTLTDVTAKLEAVKGDDLEQIAEINGVLSEVLDNAGRIKKLDRDIDYKRLALRFARELTEYLKERDPEAQQALARHLRAFGARIALS